MKRTILTIDEIKTKLNPIFKAALIYRAILFGSYAKGNPTANSDKTFIKLSIYKPWVYKKSETLTVIRRYDDIK